MRPRPVFAGLWLASTLSLVALAQSSPSDHSGRPEDVFVYRVVRVTRASVGSECAGAGFRVSGQGNYEFTALSVRDTSGEVTFEVKQKVGESLGCFGPRSDSAPMPFYSRLNINGIKAVGRGECATRYEDFPEPHVIIQDCWLKLENLSAGYVGGFVTMNSLATTGGAPNTAAARDCTGGPCGRGYESNPPGYFQTSVATMRVWRQRK